MAGADATSGPTGRAPDSRAAVRALQRRLQTLYGIELSACVGDFLCDAETVRQLAGEQELHRGEVLLVAQDEDGVFVGLYVDPSAAAALAACDGEPEGCFGAFCLVAEGVSHFVYLMYRAERDRPVSQLELELQAEVDKYATALLSGGGVGALRLRSRLLRHRLFERARFMDAPGSERGERYRLATRAAARFAARLETEHLRRGDLQGLARALRRFYRLGLREKLRLALGQ